MKIYEIFLNDVWNNNYLIGFYKNLDDAIDQINKNINSKKFYLEKGDLKEYPSTFGNCIDVSIGDIYFHKHPDSVDDFYDDDMNMWVRGFIFDSEKLIKELIKK